MSLFKSPQKLKLLFCGHDFKFLTHFMEHCERGDLYDVRVLEHQGHRGLNERKAREGLKWANVIFCEWALGNAVWFSHHKRADQVLIVRLHLQEIQARNKMSFIWEVDWSKVDKLILIAHHTRDWAIRELPISPSKACLIYNPIQTASAFQKDPSTRFTLGFVGMVPARKRLDLAIELLAEVRKTDRRYCLRIKGHRPEEHGWMMRRSQELEWYYNLYDRIEKGGLQDAVHFDPHGPDMEDWYRQIGHIVSVSDFEGSHQAVAEGMAGGAVPVVRAWQGAEQMYPPKYIAQSIRALADGIVSRTPEKVFLQESAYCRSFASRRFDQEDVCGKLGAIIAAEAARARPGSDFSRIAHAPLPTFLVVAYIPPGSLNGYRVRVEEEIAALAQAGCRVHLACLIPESLANAERELHEHRQQLEALGCQCQFIAVSNFFGETLHSSDAANVLESLEGMVDRLPAPVVHCEALYCARVGYMLKAARSEIFLSIDWHGVVPEEELMNGGRASRAKALEAIEARVLEQADLHIFVSHAMRRHYGRKYGKKELPHAVIPCCVSSRAFKKVSLPVETTLPEGTLVAAYAGSLAAWQCGEEMVRLLAQLQTREAQLHLLLLVPQIDHPKLMQWAGQHGVDLNRMILKEVEHEEVPCWLSLADAAFLLRKEDPVNRVASPTKFGEYLAAGVPVVLTKGVGDYSELMATSELALLLDEEQVMATSLEEACSEALLDFMRQSHSRRKERAQQCRQLAFETLSWEEAVADWLRALAAARRGEKPIASVVGWGKDEDKSGQEVILSARDNCL